MGNLILYKNNALSFSQSNACSNEWTRNPNWMDFPSTLTPTDETMYVLVAVFEDDFNRITLRCDNTSALIDWGDGTTQVPSSFTTYNKVYDYSAVTGGVSVYKDGRNYKQVMVEVAGSNITGIVMYNNSGSINSGGACNTLDLYASLPNVKNFSISAVLVHPYLERVRLVATSTAVNMLQGFTYCAQLKVLEIPDWSYLTNFYNGLSNSGIEKLGDLNLTNAADIRTLLSNSQISEVGDITATSISSNLGFSVFQYCLRLYKVGNVNITSTNCNSIFQQCINLREVGIITIDSGTTQINNMFLNCVLIDTIIFGGDMSGLTALTNTFNNCANLRVLIMPNVTVGFTIANCQLGTQELDDLFTSLGTASGSQTVIVTGNPGAATCDTSIATGKGWTVTT